MLSRGIIETSNMVIPIGIGKEEGRGVAFLRRLTEANRNQYKGRIPSAPYRRDARKFGRSRYFFGNGSGSRVLVNPAAEGREEEDGVRPGRWALRVRSDAILIVPPSPTYISKNDRLSASGTAMECVPRLFRRRYIVRSSYGTTSGATGGSTSRA